MPAELAPITARVHPEGDCQENRRNSFTLDGAQIDAWPCIPVYAEIQDCDRALVMAVAEKLRYHGDELTGENTTKIYARYRIDPTVSSELRFEDT